MGFFANTAAKAGIDLTSRCHRTRRSLLLLLLLLLLLRKVA